MVHHPYVYAEMLQGARCCKHGADCWLVNTGWTGGPFGVGKRISIQHTRTLLNAALEGKLNKVKYRKDPVFGFEVPDGVRRRAGGHPRPGQHLGRAARSTSASTTPWRPASSRTSSCSPASARPRSSRPGPKRLKS